MLRLPVIGNVLRKIAVARFTRTLGTLLSSGVPILDALEIVAKTAGNVIVEEGILYTRLRISEGKNMAGPLTETNIFPPMVVQMVGVGEQTGALDAMLSKIADFYEEEVDVAVGALTSLIEPAMMVGIGGTVGVVSDRDVPADLQHRGQDQRRLITCLKRRLSPMRRSYGRLAWITGLRLGFLTLLLGAVAFFYFGGELERYPFSLRVVFSAIGASYGIGRRLRGVVAIQKKTARARGDANHFGSSDVDGHRLRVGRSDQRGDLVLCADVFGGCHFDRRTRGHARCCYRARVLLGAVRGASFWLDFKLRRSISQPRLMCRRSPSFAIRCS